MPPTLICSNIHKTWVYLHHLQGDVLYGTNTNGMDAEAATSPICQEAYAAICKCIWFTELTSVTRFIRDPTYTGDEEIKLLTQYS